MELLNTILITLLTLGILVTFHEFGHFWVARRCGVKVVRFSVGFGKALFRWHDKLGTEYVIAVLPLGGYVKMVDEREEEVKPEDLPYAFNRKPVAQRIAIVAAGPIANFLLAVVVFWMVFMGGIRGVIPIISEIKPDSVAAQAGLEVGQQITSVDGEATPTWQALSLELLKRLGESGEIAFTARLPDSAVENEYRGQLVEWLSGVEEPDPMEGLGITLFTPKLAPLLGKIVEGDAAEQAGLKQGDLLLMADGKPIADWEQWVEYVRARYEQKIQLVYQRDGAQHETVITPKRVIVEDKPIGQVGVWVEPPEWPDKYIAEANYSPIAALGMAVKRTWNLSVFTLVSVKKMIVGAISAKNLSGPITIAKVASDSAKSGVQAYLSFLALLSISLGVLNLLPIPVLDGGHLLYYFAELIKGSPVSDRVQEAGFQLGLLLIVSVMMLAFYNDIMRL